MPQVTLAEVIDKAIEEESFRNKLFRNIDDALRNAKLTLKPHDREELEKIIGAGEKYEGARKTIVDIKKLFDLGLVLPPPTWKPGDLLRMAKDVLFTRR